MGFWENVEKVREYKDIPRKELAYRAEFSLNSISTGIARNSVPLADVACRIAKALDVSVEFLVTGKSQEKKVLLKSGETEKSIEEKEQRFFKYMDEYAQMVEEFSRLKEPLQKAIMLIIHESAEK